jgi:hypothetical protein
VFSGEYVPHFPLVVEYLASNYVDVGALPVSDTTAMRVRLSKDANWRARDGATGLPCAPAAAGS